MNEANPMHQDLFHALLPLIPRTTYQDIRRLNTLVWAVVGLCLTHTVRLSAWAEVLESHAQYAASRERRFSRWLHHPGIVPSEWYRPVIQAALTDWPADQRLFVALDTTALTPFVLIRASLVYRGRAIPLAWRAMHHRSTQVSFEAYQPVLKQVHALLPTGQLVTLLADRGFVHERLLHILQELGWHFRLRLPGDTLIHLGAHHMIAVKDLCPPAGHTRFFQQVAILGVGIGPVSLALAALLEQPDDPWFVASSELTNEATLQEYGLRFDIEESFRDEKSGGYQLQTSRLASLEALERLLLILALTTLHLTSIGVGIVQAKKSRFVDHHWERRLSYMELGWRWRRQQQRRAWQAFGNLATTCLTHTFPIRWTKTLSRQPQTGKMLREEYPSFVSLVASVLGAALKGKLCPNAGTNAGNRRMSGHTFVHSSKILLKSSTS